MTKTTESKAKTTTTAAAAAQDTKENNHSQGQHEKSTTKTTEKTSSKDENKSADDGKKRELSEAQIRRLKEGLRKEAEKIHKPQPKQFTPNTFHDLQPYFDMSTAIFVHELQPTDVRHGYTNRALATGLCEPTVALRMDSEIPPKVPSSTSPRHARQQDQQQKQKSKEDTERPPAEGSTRLPQFPAVHFSPKKIQKKEYRFNDVPTIRQEVHEQFSPRGSRKVEDDYKKTKADFYRMELDKMDEYSDFSRPHMKAAYFAYLQNTAGSSRAVKECVRKVENPNKDSGDERKSTGSKNEQQRGGSHERAEENPSKTDETKTAGEKAIKKDEKDAKDKKSKEKTTKKEPQQQAQASETPQQQGGKEKTDGKAEKKQAEKGEKTEKKTDKNDRGVEAQNNDAGKSTVKKKK